MNLSDTLKQLNQQMELLRKERDESLITLGRMNETIGVLGNELSQLKDKVSSAPPQVDQVQEKKKGGTRKTTYKQNPSPSSKKRSYKKFSQDDEPSLKEGPYPNVTLRHQFPSVAICNQWIRAQVCIFLKYVPILHLLRLNWIRQREPLRLRRRERNG